GRIGESGARRRCPEFSEYGQGVVVTRRDAWRHPVDVEDAVARVHVAPLDPGCVINEIGAGFLQRLLPLGGALTVLAVDPGVEALDQFFIGDGGLGNADPGAADDDALHTSRPEHAAAKLRRGRPEVASTMIRP